MVGDIVAHLFTSTIGTDTDWIAKPMDVYPSDPPHEPKMGEDNLMVAGEVVRSKFRNDNRKPDPFKPVEMTRYSGY